MQIGTPENKTQKRQLSTAQRSSKRSETKNLSANAKARQQRLSVRHTWVRAAPPLFYQFQPDAPDPAVTTLSSNPFPLPPITKPSPVFRAHGKESPFRSASRRE